jgi:hypothetical protein
MKRRDLNPRTQFDVLKGPYDLTLNANGNLPAI